MSGWVFFAYGNSYSIAKKTIIFAVAKTTTCYILKI